MFATGLFSLAIAAGSCRGPFVNSCTCVINPAFATDTVAAVKSALTNSAALFTGRILTTTLKRDSVPIGTASGPGWMRLTLVIATVQVMERFKGSLGDTVLVATSLGAESCGVYLEPSTEDLFDASSGPSELLFVGSCDLTRSLVGSSRLLEILRRARKE